ncbi:outer membrane protein [Falsiroseomonas sp.]|uniref:outer membrane protein n=1 Tax=Falsiroseomonas sp. TaxID=2870721 RepID=UPI003F709A3C
MTSLLRHALLLASLCLLSATGRAEVWTGPYLGLHLGHGWGGDDIREINGPRAWQAETHGVLGGVQAGWNWQLDRLVLGVELELGHLRQSGDIGSVDATGAVRSEASLGLHGAATGRLGWLATPDTLLFLRAGGGLAQFEASTTEICAAPCVSSRASARGTTPGLVLGLGVEQAVAPDWRVRLDYAWHLYRKELVLPPASGPGWDHRLDLHALRIGLNRRF